MHKMQQALDQLSPALTTIGSDCLYKGFINHLNSLIEKEENVNKNYLFKTQIGNLTWITRKVTFFFVFAYRLVNNPPLNSQDF